MAGGAGVTGILERGPHLALLEVAMDQARAGVGQVVVVEAPAGRGKTALLDAAALLAGDRGMTVLRATADELEAPFAFGVVLQLFEQTLRRASADERERLMAGPAHNVRSLLLEARVAPAIAAADAPDASDAPDAAPDGDPGPDPDPDARDRVGAASVASHALLWLTANLAERQPVAMLVDDLQWCDEESLRFLAYLIRRLADLPVALVVSGRPGGPPGISTTLDRVRLAEHAHHIALPPLSEAAVARLVQARVGLAEPSVVDAVVAATGGNPFLIHVALTVIEEAGASNGDDAAQLLARQSPDRLLVTVGERLAALPRPAREIAEAAAILGPAATVEAVQVLCGHTPIATKRALHELVAGDWVIVDDVVDPDSSISFRHPLIRSAVADVITAAHADRLHAAAVDVLVASGAPLEEVTTHLLASEPRGREASAALLLRAARRARHAGAAEHAVRLLRRAQQEPPAAHDLPTILAELARAAGATFGHDADELFAAAVDAAPDRAQSTRLRLSWARWLVENRRYGEATAVLDRALDGADATTAAALTTTRLAMMRLDPDRRREWDEVMQHYDTTPLDLDTDGGRIISAERAYRRGVLGVDLDVVRRLSVAALGRDAGLSLAFSSPSSWAALMHALLQCSDAPAVVEATTRLAAVAADNGSRGLFAMASLYQAIGFHRLGRLTDSLDTLTGFDDHVGRGRSPLVPIAASTRCMVQIELGELDAARAALAVDGGAERYAGEPGNGFVECEGWILLAEGRAAEAAGRFSEFGTVTPTGFPKNPSTSRWRTGLSRALLLTGDQAAARTTSDEELRLARQWGAPHVLGIVLTTAGMVRDGSEAREHLDEAVAVLDGVEPLSLAVALLERGRRQLRDRAVAPARDDLRRALALAEGCHARRVADLVVDLLRESGARPRRSAVTGVDALTPAERRVAHQAVAGGTNAEIAARLFVSRKAVEYHLSNVYRKLGINGRGELAVALDG